MYRRLLKKINHDFNFHVHRTIFGYVGTFLPLYDLTSSLPLVSKYICSIVVCLLRGRETYLTDEEYDSITNKPFPSETLLSKLIAYDIFDPLHMNHLFSFSCSMKYYRVAFFLENQVDSGILRKVFYASMKRGDKKLVTFLVKHPRVETDEKEFEFCVSRKRYKCSEIIFNTKKIDLNVCIDIALRHEALDLLGYIFRTVKGWSLSDYREIPFKEIYQNAMGEGDAKLVEFLIDFADDCKMDSEKSRGFREACRDGHTEVVKLLLANTTKTGINPAAKFNEGLLIAIRYGHFDIVNMLLDDKRVRDHFWDVIPDIVRFTVKSPHVMQRRMSVSHLTFRTIDYAFFLACEFNIGQLIKKIVRLEAIEINVLKYIQEKFASRTNHISLLKCLLNTENVSDVGIRESFVKACRDGRRDIVDFLNSKFHSNLDWESIHRGTEEACFHGHKDILSYIVNKEGEERVLKDCGGKYLIKACRNEHVDIVRLLLKHHVVDPRTEDNQAIIAAVGVNRADIVKELLAEKRVDPGCRNNEPLNICTKDLNADFTVVELLLDDPRVDPTYLENLALRNAVKTNKWRVLTKVLEDPRVNPARALVDAVRLRRVYFVRRLVWDMRLKDTETVNLLNLKTPKNIVELGSPLLGERTRANGELRENIELKNKHVQASRKRKRWIQNPKNIEMHQISVGKGSKFTLLGAELGMLSLSEHETGIPDVVSHPIFVVQEVFNYMIYGELDRVIKSYFKNKEELWVHYYILFDELKMSFLKRVICAKILSVKNEKKLWEMFNFYILNYKHFEADESVYSDLFLFTFFYYLRCSLYKEYDQRYDPKNKGVRRRFNKPYGFGGEEGASRDEKFLKMKSFKKVRSKLMNVGLYEIFEEEFLSSPFRCQRMIDSVDPSRLDEASQKIQTHVLQNYYYCLDDFQIFKDERYREHMEDKLKFKIARNCVEELRFVDVYERTLALHHGVYNPRETTLSNCSLIFTKVVKTNKNKKKRTIVQLNFAMMLLRSEYFFRHVRFRGDEFVRYCDHQEFEIPLNVLEWKDVLCFLDFLYYGVMFEKELVCIFRLLNFSIIFREYRFQAALLDRIEELFMIGYLNDSHRQLIMDIGHFFVLFRYPQRVFENLMDYWIFELGLSKKEIGSLLIRSRRSHTGRRRERLRFLRSNHALIQPIVVIDTEGVLFTTSGKGSSKRTTYWMKKVAAVKYYPESDRREEFSCLTEFPIRYKDLGRRLKFNWNRSMAIHRITWDQEGGVPPEEVLRRTRDFVGECEVFAKGKYLEVRFLNDIGCFGVSCKHKDVKTQELDYHVIELSDYGVRKYTKSSYHDPLDECHYFLDEFTRKLKVKRRKMRYQKVKNFGEFENKKRMERRTQKEKDRIARRARRVYESEEEEEEEQEEEEEYEESEISDDNDNEDEEIENLRRRRIRRLRNKKKKKKKKKIEEEEEEDYDRNMMQFNNNSRLVRRTPPTSRSSSPVESYNDDDYVDEVDEEEERRRREFFEPDLGEYEENDTFNKFIPRDKEKEME